MGALKQALKGLHLAEMRTIRRQGLATDLAGGVDYNLFTVTGGVKIHMMFGHVTTVIANVANLLRLRFTPTVTGAPVWLCAASATIALDAVNTLYIWPGTIAGQLIPSTNIGQVTTNLIPWVGDSILLVPGVIDMDLAGGAGTGIIDWYILYTPCHDGAEITVL